MYIAMSELSVCIFTFLMIIFLSFFCYIVPVLRNKTNE